MSLPQSTRTPRRSVAAATLLTLIGGALAVPGPAFGAPEYATPDPGSPAGTEYGLPFQQGRGAGGDGNLNGGGPGPGGTGGPGSSGGGPGGGAPAGGTGGAGGTATSAGTSQLFGAGITPAHGARASGSGSTAGKARGGGHSEQRAAGLSARAVSDVASARASTADGQVALIVVVLLGGAMALAVLLRLASRRSPPASAA